MTDKQELDPRKLTFSQAQGYEPIPGPLALGELSEEARIKLWDLLAFSAWSRDRHGNWKWHSHDDGWVDIFIMLHRDFLVRPLDEFTSDSNWLVDMYRDLILGEDGLDFNNIFDLFQMIMRHPDCPYDFIIDVTTIFEEYQLAYVVDIEDPPTILPAATLQEGEALTGTIKELREAGLQGAETHLKKAGELINGSDWPGAIRESIHAVESVARQLAPDASKELRPALNSLEKNGRFHPAFKDALNKLYGYTSDEEGIRHPLITNAASPAGQDEAVFMLGACASFASYLWRRHQAAN